VLFGQLLSCRRQAQHEAQLVLDLKKRMSESKHTNNNDDNDDDNDDDNNNNNNDSNNNNNNNLTTVSSFDDYVYRNNEFENMSPFEYFPHVVKSPIANAAAINYKFDNAHPQSKTHVVSLSPKPRLPCNDAVCGYY
jgi:hypothetical protein